MAASAKSERSGCAPLGGPHCRCREAVVRAFAEMMLSGAPYDDALGVAVRVLNYHHPALGTGASALVERWVSADSVH